MRETRQPVATQAEVASLRACRGCGSARLTRVLDLGMQPPSDHFPPVDDFAADPIWPLSLVMCHQCALVQLSHRSPAPEEPLAVESATLRRHAVEASRRVLSRLGLGAGTTVREFASHHGGSWLDALVSDGCRAVREGPVQLVIDNQALIHAEDLAGEMSARVDVLRNDGVLVIEFHHALEQLVQGQFDTVRHGHPLYFSLTSWSAACSRHGLTVVDAWQEDVFGGSLVVAARRDPTSRPANAVTKMLERERSAGAADPGDYARLDKLARGTCADLIRHLERLREDGKRVAAYGAGSKACTLLGVARIGPDLIPMVADLALGKHGRRVPGVRIPIVSPDELIASAPDQVIILTWDIADEIVHQLKHAGLSSTRFFVPLPTLAEVG